MGEPHTTRLHACYARLARLALLLLTPGCVPALPENLGVEPDLDRSLAQQQDRATFFAEPDLDGYWLEIDRVDEPGTVGGYLSPETERTTADLVIVLPGASSFYDEGMVAKARDYHQNFLSHLHKAGARTWTLAVRECGTPYGEGDVANVVLAIDWLNAGGGDLLAIDRIFVIGYSSGATLAMLTNLERETSGVIAISALTSLDDFETFTGFFQLIGDLYPLNAGICQFDDTLRFYGPPGSDRWNAFAITSRITDLRSPMLVIHGMQDLVYGVRNAEKLQRAYQQALAEGEPAQPMEFVYIADGTHLNMFEHPAVVAAALAFIR